MKKQINVSVNGKRILAVAGVSLSEITNGERPCGGHGKCGKCKVVARGELSELTQVELDILTRKELADGVRLACLTYALGNCEIRTLEKNEYSQIVTAGDLPELELAPDFEKYGVAIDVGTTTLAARLYDRNGFMVAQTSRLNPQQEWGADVVSRIEAALGGKADALAKAIIQAIDGIVCDLSRLSDIDAKEIGGAVITGNTVMLSLLSQEDIEPFSHAPFEAKCLFGETVAARTLGLSSLNDDAWVYLPPCISAFVGADTTCAVIATQLCEGNTAMLTDIGTNGEMALWHDGRLTVCSTAAGPAFEGVNIEMGMRGGTGAIDKVAMVNGGLNAHVIGGGDPVGICGSGLVDAVAAMLDLEMVDESGYLEDGSCIIQAPVTLTQQDIRMLQLAKSAICAGLLTLIESREITPKDVPVLYIAGGFGNYLNVHSAARIGLIPFELTKASKIVGNSALAGASAMLLSPKIRSEAERLVKRADLLELSTSRVFSDYYMSGMTLGVI